MLQPKKVKHRKQQKGRMRGKAYRGCNLDFGDYGLQALECGRLTARQIEAARIAMTRHAKRGGKVWIRVFPDKPITKKPAETRMGKGKGNPEEWVAVVKPGRVLYEMEGVPLSVAREALRLAAHKLPLATRIVERASDEARQQANPGRHGRQRPDGQDRHGPGGTTGEGPPVREVRAALLALHGPRRGERLLGRGSGPDH